MPNRTKDDLWERQPGESAQAYEAFAIYRDMGSNRSLRVVAEQLSKSDTLIKRWSREKKWGERCRAYDNHLDDVARQEALRKYKKMRTPPHRHRLAAPRESPRGAQESAGRVDDAKGHYPVPRQGHRA